MTTAVPLTSRGPPSLIALPVSTSPSPSPPPPLTSLTNSVSLPNSPRLGSVQLLKRPLTAHGHTSSFAVKHDVVPSIVAPSGNGIVHGPSIPVPTTNGSTLTVPNVNNNVNQTAVTIDTEVLIAQAFDPVLVDAYRSQPKDRNLLLRVDLEMEKLLRDPLYVFLLRLR